MWEAAPYSCHQESLLLWGTCVCLSRLAVVRAHTGQAWPALWQNTNTDKPWWLTFISARKTHRSASASPGWCHCSSVANHSATFTWVAPCFSALLFFTDGGHWLWGKCKHAEGRAGGRQGDWWGADERSCVCAGCVFVWPLGRVLHHLSSSSICLMLLGNLPARCGATSLATLKFHHLSSLTYRHATQPQTFTSHTRAGCKQGSQKNRVWALECFSTLSKSQDTLRLKLTMFFLQIRHSTLKNY